ncbi:hypothetical protein CHUV0807_0315 [Cardiobacterium hominis]|uniref:Uncharacterized protein n=1 Tax=Cardiobacterium hominis TaxID=2718 RepID=A0A1C3H254_9GAMM|nr:hypothetical protein CHUV0807_0315 [Cardiobacterium hominis]
MPKPRHHRVQTAANPLPACGAYGTIAPCISYHSTRKT